MNAIASIVPRPTWPVIVAGAGLGVAYTLSPLTVLMLPMLIGAIAWVARPLQRRERDWLIGIFSVAVVLRVAAIAGLFLLADPNQPYATFFGDEELFKSRSVWVRNIGLGVPISTADFIYAVDEVGKSSYLYALAYLYALVGDAPYGVHVFNTALYLAASCLIYRLVRPSYGRLVALGGLTILLFLPSLFLWSISALKEPLYTFLAALELWCALYVARGERWYWRIAAVAAVVGLGVVLEGLRKGGLLVAGIGMAGGLCGRLASRWPRAAVGSALVVPVLALGALRIPAVHDRAMAVVKDAAIYHVGHVYTPGYSYRTLDNWYYIDPGDVRNRMPDGDAVKFVITSMASYVVQPLPWAIESRSMLAYLPEQVIWLVLALLMPAGVVAAIRYDLVLTATLAAHGFAVMFMVALTSGNVGTLIRHRGLLLPYAIWFSVLGAYHLFLRAAARTPVNPQLGQGTLHGAS